MTSISIYLSWTGSANLSPHSLTLVSGFIAVISVNVVIGFYIYMAMKEPSNKHEPDPAFLAEAKASVNQSTSEAEASVNQSTSQAEDSSISEKKKE